MYAAVDKDGNGTICKGMPVRLTSIWAPRDGMVYLAPEDMQYLFPKLTWADEPVEFDIVIKQKGGKTCG